VLINVYLPRSSSYNWEDEYLDTLAQITNDIADVQYSHIICGVDFNVDFKSKHPLRDTICNVLDGTVCQRL